MYRIVSSTPIEETRYVFYHPFVRANFASFDALRRRPVTGEHLYSIPKLDNLHGAIASSYSTKMCTSPKILQSITAYTPLSENEKRVEFGGSMDAIRFYSLQQVKYSQFFFPMTEDKLKEYEIAAANSELYIRYFKSLLQDIENYSFDNTVSFIRKTDYDKQYKDLIWKEQLWEEIFNIDHVQRRRSRAQDTSKSINVCFDYGFETDGHIISLRFRKSVPSRSERTVHIFDELNRLPRRLDLSNWMRDLYTLSKEPTGLSLNDRIIGIDPGHRDLVTCVNTDSELTTKALRKAHSFSISNAQYQ
ncbi:hypothetical protein RMATCC62417_10603 [Rhizopus microsporus]|nr:hypothetical protein RMATCC62417_10603 [Rhizopus microsporus]